MISSSDFELFAMSEQLSIIERVKANIIAYKQTQEEKERIHYDKFNEYLRIETEKMNSFVDFIETEVIPAIIENSSNGLFDCNKKYLLKNAYQFEFTNNDLCKLCKIFDAIICIKFVEFKTSVYVDSKNQYAFIIDINWRDACRKLMLDL